MFNDALLFTFCLVINFMNQKKVKLIKMDWLQFML